MQTNLADFIRDTDKGREADSILRSCVHCGFCTATCPTYQLLGDELDGPRGRIYLIKSVLEGETATEKTQLHLDRCLTCRACETTCPSGVVYHRLLDIGREVVDEQVGRPPQQRLIRRLLTAVLPRRRLFTALVRTGQLFRPLTPGRLKTRIPPRQDHLDRPYHQRQRRVVMPEGCVQPGISPATNAAAARVLDALGIGVAATPADGCCGALRFHLGAQEAAERDMRRNIDAWWPAIEDGAEAVVSTASGCGSHIVEYGKLLAGDTRYRERAAKIADLTVDISELLVREEKTLTAKLRQANITAESRGRVAFQSPCTLQHGLGITGAVERLLRAAGYDTLPVPDSHLCCGSAGTYSILQPALSRQLRSNKLKALTSGDPDIIATANIGCQTHLQTESTLPVIHWIELIDRALADPGYRIDTEHPELSQTA
jgi:glycolate oxidase iron-sulfur subunit